MDCTTLSDAEVAVLSDPECKLEESLRRLRDIQDAPRAGSSAVDSHMAQFQGCLKLKLTVDKYEEKAASHPSLAVLSVLLNCEYQIFSLYNDCPLRIHPFLSHWVDAIPRLDQYRLERDTQSPAGNNANVDGQPTTEKIATARSSMLKLMLNSGSTKKLADYTPKLLLSCPRESSYSSSFQLDRYIQMLVEEGVYDRADTAFEAMGDVVTEPSGSRIQGYRYDEPPAEESDPDQDDAFADTKISVHRRRGKVAVNSAQKQKQAADIKPPRQPHDSKESLRHKLEASRDDALAELSRFPIDVEHLDLLTRVVQDKMLVEDYAIQPAEVICNFLGHALRTVDRMGQRGIASTTDPSVPELDELPRGPDAQKAAVQKLILFITNLIRKEVVPRATLIYDAQEIWTRYAWIQDVRNFKSFFEFGEAGDAEAGRLAGLR